MPQRPIIELPGRIPALTVWQPHSFALAMGWKPVENRGTRLPLKPGEPLAIHAGKTYDHGVRLPDGPHRAELERIKDAAREGRDEPALRLLRQSAVLCLVRFTGAHWSGDCATEAGDEHGNLRFCTPWSHAGQFHHEVTLLAALPEPVPCGGQRGKWYLPEDVERQVRAQLASTEVTHLCPPEGGLMPCCGLTPFEVPRYHRITTVPALVTCAQLARNSKLPARRA